MKISCIMPTFNRPEKVLHRIKELESQSFQDWELIIVDDGSTKDYTEIKNRAKDNIKYIRLEENSRSVSIPRAIGISHSTGELISHMDDDILIYPYKLEVLRTPFLYRNDISLCYGDRITTFQDGRTQVSSIHNWKPGLPGTWGVDGAQFIYKTDIYKKINYVFCQRACDWETAATIYRVNPNFYKIDSIVCNYIFNGSNRCTQSQKREDIYPIRFKKYFKDPYTYLPEFIKDNI